MDSPAPPSDQVRHTQVGGGEIPVFQHLEHPEQSPYKGVTTRPSKGMKNTDKNVSLRKRTHRAESRRENIWKTDPRNAGRSSGRNDRSGSWPNERTAPPTTRNSVDEMSDDAREETGPVGPPDRTDPQPPPGPARAQGHPQRTGPTGPEHSQRRTDRTEIRALQSDGTTIVSIYQIALKFVGSSQLLAG